MALTIDDTTTPAPTFTWGSGGARLTADEITSRRKVADALAAQNADGSPFPTGTRGSGLITQGLARLARGVSVGLDYREADQAAKANVDDNKKMISDILAAYTGSANAPAAAAASTVTPAVATAPDSSAPRGIRNNNALNIEDGDFAKAQPGYTGTDGRFAKFETPEQGTAAANALLDTYQTKHGLNTISGIVNRWAPAGDGNDVSTYAQDVARRMGIDPNTPLTAAQRPALIAAMGQHENGVPIPVQQPAPVQVASNGPVAIPAVPSPAAVAKVVSAFSAPGPIATAPVAGSPNDRVSQGFDAVQPGIMTPAARVAQGFDTVQPYMPPPSAAPVPAPTMPAAVAPRPAAVPAPMVAADDGEEDTPDAAPPAPAVAKVASAALAATPAPAVAKVSNALSGVNPAVIQALSSPYADEGTKKIAALLLQQQLTPKASYHQETDADGNVWNVNDTNHERVVALKSAETQPKWGVIGKDQYGQPTYGYAPTREEYAAQKAKAAAAPAPDQPDLTSVHGKDYLDTLAKQDPKYASQVQSIIEGRAPYPTGMLLKTPYGQKLAQDVTQADPTFEAGNATARVKVRNEFEAGGVGSPAGQITAGNTAIQHAGEMSDALERMKSDEGVLSKIGSSDIPYISRWANELHNSSVQGTSSGKALNDFMTAKNHFAEEVTKFYAGSAGSEAERTRALANLDAAKSLPELRSAIKTETNLMQGKVNALQDRWRNGMGPLVSDFPLVQPKSQEAIDRIIQRDAASDAPAAAAAPVAPAVAASIPHGAVVKLAQNPTPEMKAHFDEIFGAGAADHILGTTK